LDADRDRELAALLAEAQDGNQVAYEAFLVGASAELRGFLSRRMGNVEAVEDVLQDTLLSIHHARHTYLPGRPVSPWLYAICKHRMTDFYRRHRRIERVEVPAPDDIGARAAAPAAPPDDERGRLVREALGRLPYKQRHVIELLKVHDLSVKEAAARTGMSESAVKVTAFRGYQTIRKIFGVS
jgi:RNA polymerase sigma-70 factor (ECF subfamily)